MREFRTLYTDLVARQGQKPHNSRYLRDRRDDACEGAIGRAYRREQIEGRQRWIVIGEYCDGCHTFWPLSALGRRRTFAPSPAAPRADPGLPTDTDEASVPALVRFMRGERL